MKKNHEDAASKPTGENKGDLLFRRVCAACALLAVLVMGGIFLQLLRQSAPCFREFGARFLFTMKWDPAGRQFGAASSVYGTLMSTAIAMALACPVALVIALFLVEMAHPVLSRIVGAGIELLAAIPSIIYGMWGLFVFAPFMAGHVQPLLKKAFGSVPVLSALFEGPPMGLGLLTAGVILALMILPFICAVSRDVFLLVPDVVKESAYGMGATTWEATKDVTLRYGFQGILGAGFLGLGRAVGETMAITFVIGNQHDISLSLLSAGNSIASTLANEFSEASEPLYVSSLIALGLVLFLMTFIIQVVAQLWLRRVARKMGRAS
ncbi:MAG: phosphate ABC transporter permease subunit PstC [Planctomycetota bacterium]